MSTRNGYLAAAGLVLIGLSMLVFGLHRPVMVWINDEAPVVVESYAFTAGWALHDAGITLAPGDLVSPRTDQLISWKATVHISRPYRVDLYLPGQNNPKTLFDYRIMPGMLLAQAGYKLFPGDRLLQNGEEVNPGAALKGAATFTLQFLPAQAVTIVQGSQSSVVYTNGAIYANAVWDKGLRPGPRDYFSSPLATSLPESPGNASIATQAARQVTIQVDGKQIASHSAAATTGQALAEARVSLQGQDYSIPEEGLPVPEDGAIRVVRVREEIVLNESTLPFKSETVADPALELDQSRVADPGQVGIKVTRQRIRFENGKEVSRKTEAEWTAAQPRNQKIAYGTKIVYKTIEMPDGTVQYYRAVRVYATSFAPCNFIPFIGKCSYTTASGLTLQKGVIGMGEAWYRLFVGQKVYVDGYGFATVADYGYVPGFWIDLGYSDADFVNWHRYTTLYFLAPAPRNVPWVLPK